MFLDAGSTPATSTRKLKKKKGYFEIMKPIRLLFEQYTHFPDNKLMFSILEKYFGKVSNFSYEEKLIGFAVEDYVAEVADDKKMPIMIQLTNYKDTVDYQPDEMTLNQMQWSCPDYKKVLENYKYHIIAFDIFDECIKDYKKRAELTVRTAEALIEIFPTCKAIIFEHSGKMLMREDIINCSIPEDNKFIEYTVNIRFFNIQGTDDMVIDSIGMDLINLPDIQYHFHGIDPNQIVNHAYSILSYIYANNPEFMPNDTIDGLKDGKLCASEPWRVNYEDSLIQPIRLVLDVNIGKFASGIRS